MAISRASYVRALNGDPIFGLGTLIGLGKSLVGRFTKSKVGTAAGKVLASRTGRVAAGVGAGAVVAGGAAALGRRGAAGAVGTCPGHHRHSRGITATQLKGFNRVTSLLRRVGMVPKGLRHARSKRR